MLAIIAFSGAWTAEADEAKPMLHATTIRRYDAPGVDQGVAVDATTLFAVGTHSIVAYDLATGRRRAAWTDTTGRLRHLNSCIAAQGRLLCANSNFPESPPVSTIESFDAQTLLPIDHRDLGATPGYLTWAVPHAGLEWLCFARYGASGGNAATTIVAYDAAWRRAKAYTLPGDVLAAFGVMSASGGAFGPDGHLYLSGHDRGELYVMDVPARGSVLRRVATITVPGHGQAFAWGPDASRTVYTIDRATHTIFAARLPSLLR